MGKDEERIEEKILLENYLQDSFLKFYNFKLNDLSVEEFTVKFDKQRLLYDLDELKEQTTVRYLGGLRS